MVRLLLLDKMTIEEARELFGNKCDKMSDEQIKEEIETAEFFKDIFFDMLKKGKLTSK